MPRIAPVQTSDASPAQAEILAAVQKKMGMVPNLLSTLAAARATCVAMRHLEDDAVNCLQDLHAKQVA